MKHQLRPQHQDARNLAWFNQMYAFTNMGGKLITDAGAYLKTPTGWVIA